MQKITPCLWFNGNAEEAIQFYCAIFPNAQVVNVTRCGEVGPGPKGAMLAATFALQGQQFIAINGGAEFSFTEAVSFVVNCETQAEIDTMWERLSEGGAKGRCGWLKDKYGLSWQIVPPILSTMLQDSNTQKADRVMNAMLQMEKLDIATLQRAYDQ